MDISQITSELEQEKKELKKEVKEVKHEIKLRDRYQDPKPALTLVAKQLEKRISFLSGLLEALSKYTPFDFKVLPYEKKKELEKKVMDISDWDELRDISEWNEIYSLAEIDDLSSKNFSKDKLLKIIKLMVALGRL